MDGIYADVESAKADLVLPAEGALYSGVAWVGFSTSRVIGREFADVVCRVLPILYIADFLCIGDDARI